MPSHGRSREEVLALLTDVFRRDGFEGATLSVLSEETGLGRSSLYHYFPGGKVDMEEQVFGGVELHIRTTLVARLGRSEDSPRERVREMLEALVVFYDGGRKRCILERLCSSSDRPRFDDRLASVLRDWIDALVVTLVDGGVDATIARVRAEQAVALVQGALVLSDALHDTGPFDRALSRLAVELLDD